MKISPLLVAVTAAVLGCGLLLAGVFVLLGLGWALVSAAVPFLLLSLVIVRGLSRAE